MMSQIEAPRAEAEDSPAGGGQLQDRQVSIVADSGSAKLLASI